MLTGDASSSVKVAIGPLPSGDHSCAGCRYTWLAHRDPADAVTWQLAARGKALWEQEAEALAANADSDIAPLNAAARCRP